MMIFYREGKYTAKNLIDVKKYIYITFTVPYAFVVT